MSILICAFEMRVRDEIINFNQPEESEINEALEQYGAFGQERFASKMSEINNEDAFQSARVNLNNLAF